MAFWPLRNGPEPSWPLTSGALTPTTVSASGTAHTKGAWTEVIASTPSQASGFLLIWGDTGTSGTNTSTLLDVGIGGAGSEVVLLPDWQVGYSASTAQGLSSVFIPLQIAGGVRVSVRTQSAVTSKTATVAVVPLYGATLAGGGMRVFSKATTLGADTSTSGSTLASLSGGTWVEAVASSAEAYGAVRTSWVGASSMANVNATVEVGVGGSGSETMVDQLVELTSIATEYFRFPYLAYTAFSRLAIPAGSRISVRAVWPSGTTNIYPIVHLFS